MSDSETDYEQRHKARQMMAEACAAWIDQWDWTAGSIVTGFVVVLETQRPNGRLDCTWGSGSGADVRDEDLAGLPAWRIDGMVRKVSADLYSGDVQSE